MPIMTPMTSFDASSQEWVRVGYADMGPATKGGGNPAILAPAIPIIVRNPLERDLPDVSNVVRAMAIVDTGATRSSIPMWAALQLGIVRDGDVKRPAFGVGGRLVGYRKEIGIKAWIGSSWLDAGISTALVPDTKRSRNKSGGQPFLLGRDGFLDRVNVCFDEPNKEMRLRRVA